MSRAKKDKKVLVAMSGGVDSSVAAALLKEQGYQVSGVFLQLWKDDDSQGNSAMEDARSVAKKLNIDFHVFDYRDDFKTKVVDQFLEDYVSGITPNPCVGCNKKIKIGKLLTEAKSLGFDYLATGHYLKIKKRAGEFFLYKAKDKNKDQSYFLYTLSQLELKHLIFPLANLNKNRVRKLADKYDLHLSQKKESQDVCFISKTNSDFLKQNLKLVPGDIILLDTKQKIGEHQGLPLYTIGQRKGLVGGIGPFYVSDFDYEKNILYVVKDWHRDKLYKQECLVKELSFLSDKKINKTIKAQAVIRYGHKPVACKIFSLDNSHDYRVIFSKPQRAVTPGQSIVFYQKKKILGGGIISV